MGMNDRLRAVPLVGPPLAAAARWLKDLRSPSSVFARIYTENGWGDPESRSGSGSTMQNTEEVRRLLPGLLAELGVGAMLDVPCGDFHWMSSISMDVDYIGGDIVDELVIANRRRHAGPRRRFERIDLLAGGLPRADLVLCRDCLVHLSFRHVFAALASIRASGSTWLLTTTFDGVGENRDIATGNWRRLDLTKPPFSLPLPDRVIDERCPGPSGNGKRLGLWRVADIPAC
jgi:hypothetical protein